jgi:iron complex transport system permease protein
LVRLVLVAIACLAVAAAGGAWYLTRGEPNVSYEAVWQAIRSGGTGEGNVGAYLIRELRLPRLLLGLSAGAALGLAGAILQDTLRNPIADPSLLGVNGAASLAIALLFFAPGLLPDVLAPAVALVAGLAAGAVLVVLARSIRDPVRLVLIGALMSALLFSVTSVVLLVAPNTGGFNVTRFMTYLAGSLSGASWDRVAGVVPWLLLAFPLGLMTGRTLNVLQLGDEVAAGLGMSVTLARFRLLFVAVLLVAPVVWAAGPIGFVALLSAHVARSLTGTGNAHSVLPASALVGAIVVLGSDVAGRLLFFPTEIPAGLFTIAIVGPIAALLAGPGLRTAPSAAGPP